MEQNRWFLQHITRLDKPVIPSLHLQRILFWKNCVFVLSILRKKSSRRYREKNYSAKILYWIYGRNANFSSVIDTELKSHPQMIYVLSLRFVEFVQIEDYIKIGDTTQVKIM